MAEYVHMEDTAGFAEYQRLLAEYDRLDSEASLAYDKAMAEYEKALVAHIKETDNVVSHCPRLE